MLTQDCHILLSEKPDESLLPNFCEACCVPYIIYCLNNPASEYDYRRLTKLQRRWCPDPGYTTRNGSTGGWCYAVEAEAILLS